MSSWVGVYVLVYDVRGVRVLIRNSSSHVVGSSLSVSHVLQMV